jgi:predicted AlkP superfamily pyrophosphatase or phosphodiesterase
MPRLNALGGFGFALLVIALIGCEQAAETSPKKPYVLILGIDGTRPDALEKANTPALDSLRAKGAWTMNASTQQKTLTKSGPGWASIITGVDADKHHVVDNDTLSKRNPEYPTLFRRAKQLGLSSAVAPSWAFFLQLVEPDTIDSEFWSEEGDEGVTKWTERILKEGDQQLTFIHFDNVDHAGHSTGFSPDNPEYVSAIEGVDSRIGRLLKAVDSRSTRAQERWLFVVVTDHGGEGTDHGAMNEINRRIFTIFSGDGVANNKELFWVTQMDLVPTILSYFGQTPDPAWNLDGQVVELRNIKR